MPKKILPVFDLHCDLLSYLAHVPGADPAGVNDIGASLFYLQNGGVKLQVMAHYTDASSGSSERSLQQAQHYQQLCRTYADYLLPVKSMGDIQEVLTGDRIGVLGALENAAGLCEADEPIEMAFQQLERLNSMSGPLLYIGFTHHGENRFGGGNMTNVGLKEDGKALLEYMDGKEIAVDLSHASDALAEGIFTHISQKGLKVPVLASHSNFRTVWEHPRNLPDEFVQEIVQRKGLIGMNFLRAYVDDERPEALAEHIMYGLEKAEDALCYGADFFYTKDHPDPSRKPFYFAQHDNAGKYPYINKQLMEAGLNPTQLKKLCNENVQHYLKQHWVV